MPLRSLVPAAFAALLVPTSAGEWTPLFNGRDLEGWTTTIQGLEPGLDPQRHVQVKNGEIHMYPDVEEGTEVSFGVITHDRDFSRFQFRFEYRWLGKRFPPRADKLRDAGVIYHVKDISKVWPAGVECQVQEGDTGDIVLINCGGTTWMHPDPDTAPEGQGDPGMLPENGGLVRVFEPSWPYVGRFEEADSPSGWNRVVLTVHGADTAVHEVNGRLIARIGDMVDLKGEILDAGRISLQLEGAQIAYRNIEVRELDARAKADQKHVGFSSVSGQKARGRAVTIANPRNEPLATPAGIIGADAGAFRVVDAPETLAAGASGKWNIEFHPNRGAGRYSAGLQVGDIADGVFIVLQGVALDAFEGKNEPPLQRVVHALGIPLDVGGGKLELDTKAGKIGDGAEVARFTAVNGAKVRVTPVARFSPPGATPVGVITAGGETREIAKLADSSPDLPDAHQCLMPPFEDGRDVVEFDAPDEPFAFFMRGHKYRSATDPALAEGAPIPHTARVYQVSRFQGRLMKDAWLVGFEEASNGDYQDAVLLIENVRPAER